MWAALLARGGGVEVVALVVGVLAQVKVEAVLTFALGGGSDAVQVLGRLPGEDVIGVVAVVA